MVRCARASAGGGCVLGPVAGAARGQVGAGDGAGLEGRGVVGRPARERAETQERPSPAQEATLSGTLHIRPCLRRKSLSRDRNGPRRGEVRTASDGTQGKTRRGPGGPT